MLQFMLQILVVKYSDVYHPHSYVCLLERFLFKYDLLSLLHSTAYITGKHVCMSFDAAFLLSNKRLEAEANHAIINAHLLPVVVERGGVSEPESDSSELDVSVSELRSS